MALYGGGVGFSSRATFQNNYAGSDGGIVFASGATVSFGSNPVFFNNTGLGPGGAFTITASGATEGNLLMGDSSNITQNSPYTLSLFNSGSLCATSSFGNFYKCPIACNATYDQPAGVLACTPAPTTSRPTRSPTTPPTQAPTLLRPVTPSGQPTASPTQAPTTQAPSGGPTTVPSRAPTLNPTFAPTRAPTVPLAPGLGKLVPVETGNWTGVAASGNGTVLVALNSGSWVYVSYDAGADWVARNGTNTPGAQPWTSGACVRPSSKGYGVRRRRLLPEVY